MIVHSQVAVVSDDSFYLLQYNAEVVEAALAGVVLGVMVMKAPAGVHCVQRCIACLPCSIQAFVIDSSDNECMFSCLSLFMVVSYQWLM